MEIEEVKTWQWMLAGLIAGALFSCIVAWSGPGYDTQPRDTIEAGEFENAAYAQTKISNQLVQFGKVNHQLLNNIEKYHKGLPRLRSVTVHPPLASDPEHRYWVTGESYTVGMRPRDAAKPASGEEVFEEWKPFKYGAKAPYEPGYALREDKGLTGPPAYDAALAELKKELGGKKSFPTVIDYLKAVQAMPNANVQYRTAWWERPGAMWSLPPAAGFLFIGVAWPMTLSLMQNFGVAKRPQVKAKPKPVAPLEPMRIPQTTGVSFKPDTPAPPPPVPTDSKAYGGEFYPVAKVAQHDEVKPGAAPATTPAAGAKPAALKTPATKTPLATATVVNAGTTKASAPSTPLPNTPLPKAPLPKAPGAQSQIANTTDVRPVMPHAPAGAVKPAVGTGVNKPAVNNMVSAKPKSVVPANVASNAPVNEPQTAKTNSIG